MTIGMATPTVEELEAENERLRKRIKFIYESSKNDIYAENERLRKECKVRHDLLQKFKASDHRLRAALESIAKNTCCDNCQEAALVAREALKDG